MKKAEKLAKAKKILATAMRAAEKKREAMSEVETRDNLSLTSAEARALNRIAAGLPMRSAATVLRAIEMKLAYTMKKPAQQVDTDSKITIEVVTLGTPKEEVPLP